MNRTLSLRPYQERAVAEVYAARDDEAKRVILVLPTGGGKTEIAAALFADTIEHGGRGLFLTHRLELVDQAAARIAKYGARVGVIQGSTRPDPDAPVQVASVQSLARREHPEANLVITDEAHHAVSDSFETEIRAYPDAFHVGLTATPYRLDGKGLGKLFERIIVAAYPRELIELGYLVAPRIYTAPPPDLTGVRKAMGDYVTSQLSERMTQLTGNVVSTWLSRAADRKTVVFAVDIAHSKALRDRFLESGISAEHFDGEDDGDTRKATLARFRSGETRLLANCSLISEGFDLPEIGCVVMARPTASRALYKQQCLDSATEILTRRGWATVGGIAIGDTVAAMDTETGAIEWTSVTDAITRPLNANEKMVGIQAPHLDIRVTGGHTMVVKARGVTAVRWVREQAGQTARRKGMWTLPVSGLMEDPPPAGLTDAEIRFIGWVLTDGCVGRAQVHIGQSSEAVGRCQDIRDTLASCGFRFGEYRAKRTGTLAHCPDLIDFSVSFASPRRLTDRHLRGCGQLLPWLDKSFPPIFETLNNRQIGLLLNAMNEGDGQKSKTSWVRRTMTITTGDNEKMADAMQALIVRRGFRCNKATGKTPERRQYYLHIKPNTRVSTVAGSGSKDGRITGGQLYVRSRFGTLDASAGEIVWCVTNRLGTLVTRRNGKVAIVGNCGRAMRPAAGKTDCILLDNAGNFGRHGDPLDVETYTLEDGVVVARPTQTKTCKGCFAAIPAAARTCPYCGYAPPIQIREVMESADELMEVSAIQAHYLAMGPEERFELYKRLSIDCERLGFKTGWIAHQYKSKFGIWPEPEIVARAEAGTSKPIEALSKWIATAAERGWKPGWAQFRFKAMYGRWPTRREMNDAGV